jgi:trimethylamine:corrinoid methyltransferase-like protein
MNGGSRFMSPECLEAMVSSALRMIEEIGIETNRQDVLERARGLSGLVVRGDRIHVAPGVAREVIEQGKVERLTAHKNRVWPVPDGRVEHPTINVSDRATWIADHHARELKPLTRADVIAGTRLIDALSPRCVEGTTSGTPQDTIAPLQPIEQYLIGFRYSRNGGSTCVPLTPEAAGFLSAMREVAEEDFDPMQRRFSVWVPSPLKLEGNELDDLLDSGAQVLSFYVGSMPIMGMTGPVDPVGVYTLALAETLGGAAILHRLFPDARASFYPHPEPMDPATGVMAFGTPEWARLELMQKEILEHLGMVAHRMDILTSACMPDAQAQADKMAALALGVAHGTTCFNLFPLCADEAWSHAQLVLDVEYVHRAWQTRRWTAVVGRAEDAFETVAYAVRADEIVGAMKDTVLHLRENYFRSPLPRVFTSSQWGDAGRPDPLADAEAYALELIGRADYAPAEDRFRKVVDIYHQACREFGAEPMELD